MNRLLPAIARESRFGSLATIALFALLGAVFGVPASALASRHHHAAAHAAKSTASAADVQPYAEACLMEPTTGTFIFEKNDHQPWPTASLAKMMLMLIVAEKLHDGSLKPTDQVTTSRKAAKMGGSQVYLKEGETFSLDDMMKAVVVHSANDASVAVAEYVAGSTDAFVQMMNSEAARLGMKDTHYYSVHGLPPGPGEKPDVASAYDQALLAAALLKYPEVLKWSAIDTAPFRDGKFTLRNTNHLVRTYHGCDGLKTGFYDKAGFNVVATAKRGDLRLVAVVLGTPHKLTNFKEAAVLMSEGFANYEMRAVAKKGAVVPETVAVKGGAQPSLKPVFGGDATIFTKRDAAARTIKVEYKLPESLAAPIKAGQQVGTASIVADGRPVSSVMLVAPAGIPKKSGVLSRIFGKL
jgi:serine-type D-Ala-D-Ala carboxypeptidase (penicillin-binding protein 5/6)